MKPGDIFHKTAKGQLEIASRTQALSLKERRVLILVNGKNDAATLKAFSRCDNIDDILENLVVQGFIDLGSVTAVNYDYARKKGRKLPRSA